ncbi:MAG: Rrf2 family transcriptional regulator [Clostridiales bacterium]|jgi:Rrf2 family protein|nr:Rrf2 family transcriptional regulator [Clostridiales bacterium]
MKVSTKGRYGLKAIVDIAYSMEKLRDKCVSVKSIAERQGMSENYLEQIMAPLKKARIVHSIRGANGGYYLAKPAEELTAGDILRILEGPLVPVDCVIDGTSVCGAVDCALCVMKDYWHMITKKINEIIDSITIAELAQDFDRLSKEKDSSQKGT